MEDKKVKTENKTVAGTGAAETVAKDLYGAGAAVGAGGARRSDRGNRNNSRGPRRSGGRDGQKDDMDQRILEVARVTRVMAGGKRMNFRACVAIGDKKGSVGVGLGKGADVTMAVNKAVNKAKKKMVKVPLVKGTIPHVVAYKSGAARLIMKPAKQGRGIIAGGVARAIFELAGIGNITSKTLGSKSKINNARCVIEALETLRRPEKKDENDKGILKEKSVNKER